MMYTAMITTSDVGQCMAINRNDTYNTSGFIDRSMVSYWAFIHICQSKIFQI